MKKITTQIISALWIMSFFISCSTTQSYERQSNEITGYEQPLTVRVKVILLQRNDGTGNFDLNDSIESKVLKDFVKSALDGYQNFVQPEDLTGCYDKLDFMPSALIDFTVEYAEVRNTYGWNYRNSGSDLYKNKLKNFSPNGSWYLSQVDDSITQAEKLPTIHIYFTNDGERFDQLVRAKGEGFVNNGKAAGQFPTSINLNRSSQIHMPNKYLSYISMRYQAPEEYNEPWNNVIRNWYVINGGNGLTHELGHNFGLSHSNEYHKSNKCKYSIMSQKGNHPRNYLQPTEIKKIHKNLQNTNMMQYVTAESHYGFTQAISANTQWDSPRRYYNDFSIKPNVTLTISDSIVMPLRSSITIDNKATVNIVKKGVVTYPDGSKFTGWNGQGKLNQ